VYLIVDISIDDHEAIESQVQKVLIAYGGEKAKLSGFVDAVMLAAN